MEEFVGLHDGVVQCLEGLLRNLVWWLYNLLVMDAIKEWATSVVVCKALFVKEEKREIRAGIAG